MAGEFVLQCLQYVAAKDAHAGAKPYLDPIRQLINFLQYSE